MKIHNIRLGFATNSSSTHSILLDPRAERFHEGDKDCYGWENFMLRTKKEKQRYFASQLYMNLCQSLSKEYALMITHSFFGEKLISEKSYVDHQSVFTLPSRYDNPKETDLEFAKEFFDYVIKNGHLGIAGGNDNGDGYNYGGVLDPNCMRLPKDYHSKDFVCRKDGAHWIIFSKKNGAKIRLSFEAKAPPYFCSTAPELVDIRLTNFCPFGCHFCSQSSTIEGKHSNIVPSILQELSNLKVLECAYGGGEPTMHPGFAEILQITDREHIVPNFTTFTTRWTHDPEISQAVLKYCGGFALSVNEYAHFHKIREIAHWKDSANFAGEVSIQAILGISDDWLIASIMKEMNKASLRKLTLLGYKSYGRASVVPENKVQTNNISDILKWAKENYISIGMDTKGVQTYKKELEKAGINNLLMTEREGVFSCYIDAVNMFIAPDSYHEEPKYYFDLEWNSPNHFRHVMANAFPFVEKDQK